MKQKTKTWIAALIMIFISLSAFSQEEQEQLSSGIKAPRWASDKGYWVVESNINSPLDHTIRFYTNDNVMIYKETVTGIRLNPAKRKVKMKLKKALEASVLAWEQKKVPEENKQYLAAILK